MKDSRKAPIARLFKKQARNASGSIGALKACRILCTLVLIGVMTMTTLLSGCTSAPVASAPDSGLPESGDSGEVASTREIIIGSMVTEDILPMWVAEAEGLFAEQGINARVETFQSAQELSTAVVSGSVDMAMTDIMVSATITASGTPVIMEWITLGATAEQGRFGILANPESGITSLKDLAGVPVGVGSNTMVEYVMYQLMKEAGLSDEEIVCEEIKKVPVRYEMMTANQIAAAALPGSLLALGEATGMVLVADDSTGNNLSSTVMIVRKDIATTNSGLDMIEKVGRAWDAAVDRINASPESYRGLLTEKAQLPEIVRDDYKINTYPKTQRPATSLVKPVLDWMYEKGYLGIELTYDYSTGSFNT